MSRASQPRPHAAAPSHAAASWALVALLAAGAALRPACIEPGAAVGFESGPMLAELPGNVIEPALAAALSDADALEVTVQSWLDARLGGQPGDSELASAQNAWRAAAASWQRVEVHQIGPAASSTTGRGGLDLRDEVYSWPTVNPCRVDQEIVLGEYDAPDFRTSNLVNVYGLDALEYLLFHPAGNDCAGQHPMNDEGTWDALGEVGVLDRRAEYSLIVVEGVRDDIAELSAQWSSGGFAEQFADAGEATSVYVTQLSAVNAVFDALFYLELQTKDAKLGVPLGVVDGCGAPPCIDLLESQWANQAAQHVAANLQGFRALYTGGEGLGLDDLLVSIEEQDLNNAILDALDAADQAAADMPTDLPTALAGDAAPADALFAATKVVTDLLKNELASTLLLQIPSEAGGDND